MDDKNGRLSAFFAAAPVGMAMFDQLGRCVRVNDAFARLAGVPADECTGRGWSEPSQLRELQLAVQQVLTTGTAVTELPRATFASWTSGRRGTLFASRAPSGEITGLGMIVEEDRVARSHELLDRATTALAESIDPAKTFPTVARVAIPSLADFCYFDLCDQDGRLQRVAWSHADPALEADWERRGIPLPPAPDAHDHPIIRAIATGQIVVEPHLTPDWFEQNPSLTSQQRQFYRTVDFTSAMIVPLRIHDRVVGTLTFGYCEGRRTHTHEALGIAEELARRVALAVDNARHYADARSAVQAGEQILAMVSHDLRSPLSTITLALEALRERGEDKSIDIALRAIDRMRALIEDLLDAAAIQAGKLAVGMHREDAGDVLDELFEAHVARAEAKGIHFECAHDLGGVMLRCDRMRLLQALGNLTGNAIKFCPAGARIVVRGSRTDQAVTFEIADTGPGIPPGEVPYLFERYWTAPRGAPRGTGLGLFIAKRIVDAHRGTISVETALDRDTTFRVELPFLTSMLSSSAAS